VRPDRQLDREGCRGAQRLLVLRGEPGIGKSALLDYAIEKRAFCHLLRGEVSNPRCSCRTQHSTNCCIPS